MGLHIHTDSGLSLTPGQIKHMWSMRGHPAVPHEWVRGRWVCALCGKPVKRRLRFGRWVHGARRPDVRGA